MSFHQQPWAARFSAMGDEAEAVFEAVYPKGWTRYGLCRPGIRLDMIPYQIRYTPDYLTSDGLVEVQGFGRDGMFKLKIDKRQALAWWNDLFPVSLFLFDRTNMRWAMVTFAELDKMTRKHGVHGTFPEGKAYVAVDGTTIGEWTALDAPL